jgi:acyl-CoA hydrolase
MTDFYFLSPVEIGDGLSILAEVTYTQGGVVIVTVEARTINFRTEQKKLCCSSQIILKTKSESVKKVYPDSYS